VVKTAPRAIEDEFNQSIETEMVGNRPGRPSYGYSDPYRGLYDFYAVPPYNAGYSYGHVRPGAGDSLAR
jgi:hypothetical protein